MENDNRITSAYNATIWKQSIAKKGENNPNYNKPCSDVIKKKISDSQKIRWDGIRKALQKESKDVYRVNNLRNIYQKEIENIVITVCNRYLHELFTDQF